MIQNEEMMTQTIHGLHELGFTFALDDFGTGYSTYSYMLQLPLSIIKIDKSILWAAEKSEQNKIILQHTIEMVKDLGRKVVVEGVETEKQKTVLVSYGADFLQGYYFSKALRETEFLFYLQRVNAKKSKSMKSTSK
jgi:sensor c-di-GMP phosphodiesterase-like protein